MVLVGMLGLFGIIVVSLFYVMYCFLYWYVCICEEILVLSLEQLYVLLIKFLLCMLCFVKEILWLWLGLFVLYCFVLYDIDIEGVCICKGGVYELLFYFQYYLLEYWQNLDSFDLDCWLFECCQVNKGVYVLFGFLLCVCIGSVVGYVQLLLFCVLVICDFELLVQEVLVFWMQLEGFVILVDFIGMLMSWCV